MNSLQVNRKRAGAAVLSLVALLSWCLADARAQEKPSRPKAEVKAGAGISTFNVLPNDNLRHTVFSAAVRIYVWRRLSVEPEVLFMQRGAFDRDVLITPHVAFDLMDPRGRVVPYVIAGVGAEHHRDQITFTDFFNGNTVVTKRISGFTMTANAGAGVKLFLTNRLFIAPDVRVGHEPNFRATVSVGYVFAGRKR